MSLSKAGGSAAGGGFNALFHHRRKTVTITSLTAKSDCQRWVFFGEVMAGGGWGRHLWDKC